MSEFCYEAPYGVETIKKIIPHRFPFLFVDGITAMGDDWCRGYKMLTTNEEVFQGHFPGHPVFPGVLQIELIAQVGACWILSRKEHMGKVAYLMSVESAKFRRPVEPGDRLDVSGKITNLKSRTGRLEGQIFVGDALVSEVNVMFAFSKVNTNGAQV